MRGISIRKTIALSAHRVGLQTRESVRWLLLMHLEALPFKMISLLSRGCDERVLVCRAHYFRNAKSSTADASSSKRPLAGTSHCGSYKSPGPEEHAVINSSLKRDGEFVFFLLPSRVYPALSQSALYFSPPSGGLSSNQSDAVRRTHTNTHTHTHTHIHTASCVCVCVVVRVDWQVVIISHWGGIRLLWHYLGVFRLEIVTQIIVHIVQWLHSS